MIKIDNIKDFVGNIKNLQEKCFHDWVCHIYPRDIPYMECNKCKKREYLKDNEMVPEYAETIFHMDIHDSNY